MLSAIARRRVAALRQPVPAARIARALWIVWALVVWNVTFDRVIVVAGRQYVQAAFLATSHPGAPAYLRMDDWMRPAVSRGFWIATALAGGILLTGLFAVHTAVRTAARRATSCA